MNNEQLELLAKVFDKTVEDTEELAKFTNLVKNMRDFTCQRKGLTSFEFGDLVIDVKNNELGFVIGPFAFDPVNVPKNLELDLRQVNDNRRSYLIVTLSKKEDKNKREFRCRYVMGKFLKPINIEARISEFWNNDLETHCQSQCFLECSSDCSLWKYRKKKDRG